MYDGVYMSPDQRATLIKKITKRRKKRRAMRVESNASGRLVRKVARPRVSVHQI